MRRAAPLIIGAGPAGCAAAIMLARGGANPLVLEASRDCGDALCGGFVSWRTMETLQLLGLSADQLGHRVTRLRLFAGHISAESALPRTAIGVSRRLLDSLLQKAAISAGAAIERGVAVRALDDDVRLADATSLSPETVMVATGKHGLRGLERVAAGEPAVGLRLRLPAHPGLQTIVGDSIELHLFSQGYAGLVLQEDGSANFCMAVRKDRLTETDGSPAKMLAKLCESNPALGERLAYWDGNNKIDAIGAVPYGWIAGETNAGQFLLGDAAACIPSLAGEGNGLALASGVQAAAAWMSGDHGIGYQRAFALRVRQPVHRALRLWHLAERPLAARLAVRGVSIAPWLAALAADLTRIDR